ncbi:DUF4236 domain-containing protein [Vibrio atypicus]|uniref:DUF4236 domain-containing protein n=1 Tax=Vibrio atypicus TaxID=558271 RepID=UPI001359C296|nr:DUF4236 domain-containing protein [Vibrio atypicus]
MGLRFRRRLKVAPGLTLNLSWSEKRGITTSSTVGVPGANVNVGTQKDGSLGVKRGTLGIPGSGLSYHENLDDSVSKSTSSQNDHDSERLDTNVTSGNIGDKDKSMAHSEEPDERNDFTALQWFAYSRTINWVINLAILGGLFYLNY